MLEVLPIQDKNEQEAIANLCGVHRAYFDAKCDNETLVKAIGFSRNADGRFEMDLTDFFKEPCKHSH